jgi:hypothetical protein
MQHQIIIENGKINKTNISHTYLLVPINGMKYSHTIQDSLLETLVEGVSSETTNITLRIKNAHTSKIILSNKFIVK